MSVRARLHDLRGGIVTLLVLTLVIGIPQDGVRLPPVSIGEVPGFSLAPLGDEVARLSPITVTFASPPTERSAERVLLVEPATRGTYNWLSSRTALFQPDFPGLLRGQTYTVSVPARPEAGLPDAVTKKFTVTGRLVVQQVIPGNGDTEVPLGAPVLVQFSRSVAPLTTLSGQRADPIITFDPPLQGKGEWLNTSIYRFVPSELRPTTTYRLRIAKGLTSAADGVLEADFQSTFTTIAPGVAQITPDDNTQFASPTQQVAVTFNQPMDRSAMDGISVQEQSGRRVPGAIAWSEGDAVATFMPSGRLAVGTVYIVMIEKGLRGARGGETASARSSSFRTAPPPGVQNTSPRNGETSAGRYGVNIQFATPMDPTSLEGKLSISGFTAEELEGHIFTSETGLNTGVTLTPSTAYSVTLAPGATDRYGQVMGGYTFSFRTGELPATVTLALPGYSPTATLSSSAEPLLYFQATNTPSVSFTMWQIAGDQGRALMHDFGRSVQDYTPPGSPRRTWTETFDAKRDEVFLGVTSLSGGGPLPKGYYFVRSSGQYQSMFVFAVVDTVIVTKLADTELLAWALDHDTGRPVSGTIVRATGPSVSPGEVRTDPNGLASFAVPPQRIGESVDRAYIVWIDEGARTAVSSTRWSQGTSPFQFGLASEFYSRQWVAQVYTDRPIYRPGETVQYKGIVRADDDAQYSLPPSEPPLRFVIRNARGQEQRAEPVRLSEFGSFGGTFELPADAPLGDYFMAIEQKLPNSPGDFQVAGNSFLVAEFRKPEFEVQVAPAKPSYVNGDLISVRTTASFFFGGAVADAPVDWSVTSEPLAMRVSGYEQYSFADFDYARQAVVRQGVRSSGRVQTGADGTATFSVPAALAAAEGAQRFTLGATVAEQNGQSVAGSGTVTVHPAALYAGIRPAFYVATEGRDAKLDLVTVDTDGAIMPAQSVAIRVYDRQWITTKELVPGGGRRYRSDVKDTLLTTLNATTDAKGEASVTYRPTKAGSLRVVAEVTDALGRVARSATFLWVAGIGFASWQVTNDDVIKLVADKDRYEVGDTAEILVPAPFVGATGLVSVERGKVITRDVREFPTNSERLRITITDRAVPNVFVSVVLYRAPTAADPIPRYKVGYVQLPVSTATRALTVTVRPDRVQAKPGDTVRYAIAVTDKDGKGVRSELSVAVVDKAVLALQDERGPTGLLAFWFERGLSVSTGSSMAVSIDRWNDVIAEAARQGKGGSGAFADRLRQEFRNTAFWGAQIVTKDDGTTTVDVPLPDSLTTWRLQARAISGTTMVGEGTNELVSTKPLLLRPAPPRFLRVGDAAQIRALVRNATNADSNVTVALKAEGVTVSGSLSKTVTVRAGASELLTWQAKADAEGPVKLTFTGTGSGGLEDKVTQDLVALLDVTPETTATGGIVSQEGALEALYLPSFANTKYGALSVSVASALVSSMADELKGLAPTPQEGAAYVASRLIATLGVSRAEQSAGIQAARAARISSDIAGLVGRQRPEGGWAWCDDPLCQTDPNVTGLVLFALGEARRDSLTFDTTVWMRATEYVFGYVNRITDVASPADTNQKAFLLAALASAGQTATMGPSRALFEQARARLVSWGRAYLILSLSDAGAKPDDPQIRALLDDLAAATIPSASGNHWEDQGTNGAFMTSTATTALVALALSRLAPEHALLPQSVRWLVVARGAHGWQTSIDRAMGVLALASYAVTTGELGGDYEYKVQLDAKDVLTGVVKPGAAPTTAAASLPLTRLTPGKMNVIEFTRDYARPGRLYYTLDLRYVTPAKEIEALNRGFAISHEYTLLDDPSKPITSAKLGDTVRVKLTVIVPSDRNYVTVEDLLPAGLEPVDARLKNVDPALKVKLEAERLQAAQTQSGGYAAPWFRWYYSPWQQVDLRDDRTVLFADRLAKGVYEYIYYTRAATPGEFFVGPAHAAESYFPEVFGRSDSGRFIVSP